MRKALLLFALVLLASVASAQTYQLHFRAGEVDTAISTALRLPWAEVIYDSTILTTSRKYSYFSTMEDTIVVDTVMAYGSTTANLTLQITYDPDRSASGTNVFTSAQTVNSSTTGNKFTSFSNATIPKNNHIWITTPTVTTAPRELVVIMRFHYKNLR